MDSQDYRAEILRNPHYEYVFSVYEADRKKTIKVNGYYTPSLGFAEGYYYVLYNHSNYNIKLIFRRKKRRIKYEIPSKENIIIVLHNRYKGYYYVSGHKKKTKGLIMKPPKYGVKPDLLSAEWVECSGPKMSLQKKAIENIIQVDWKAIELPMYRLDFYYLNGFQQYRSYSRAFLDWIREAAIHFSSIQIKISTLVQIDLLGSKHLWNLLDCIEDLCRNMKKNKDSYDSNSVGAFVYYSVNFLATGNRITIPINSIFSLYSAPYVYANVNEPRLDAIRLRMKELEGMCKNV